MKPSRARQALDPDAARLPLAGGLLLFVPIALLGNAIGSTLQYPEGGASMHCLLAVTTPGGAAAVPQPLAIAGS